MKPYYDEGGITLYHGDALDILPTLERQPSWAVVTDPPYGIEYATARGRGEIKGYASWSHTTIANDDTTACRDFALAWARGLPIACFGSWKVPKPVGVRGVLIWDKGPAFGMGDLSFPWKPSWEEIYILGDGWNGRRDEGVLKGHLVVSWESKGRWHPNEKPVSLCCHIIGKTEATVIVDPFAGSGSTLRAAKDCGRRAIGIEIEERYCEAAVKRLAQGVFDFQET